MKILLIIICAIMAINIDVTYCEPKYARVIENGVCLYKTASQENSTKNIICILENTYYVEVILTYDEDFYKVKYNNVSGFVLRKCVKKVSGTPQNPYPNNVKMRSTTHSVYLRHSPSTTSNPVATIPANCESINYVGEVYGEQVDDFRQNTWYFVEFQGTYGYIYGEYIVNISRIEPNYEALSFLNNSDFDDIINPLSNGICTLIIVVLLLPTLLLILLVYKKPKKKNAKFKEQVIVVKEIDDKL